MTAPVAPGDDEIVEAMWDAYSAVRDKDLHASCRPAMAAALAVARPMILRQAAQGVPASTMRSAEEVRAEMGICREKSRNSDYYYAGWVDAFNWVLNEQETGTMTEETTVADNLRHHLESVVRDGVRDLVMGLVRGEKVNGVFPENEKMAAEIRTYGDQRAREALERAVKMVEAADWKKPAEIRTVCERLRTLIPKGHAND